MKRLVTTHSLEINSSEAIVPAEKAGLDYLLVRAEIASPELNRYLYASVGARWCWYERLTWDYSQWLAFLQRDEVGTWVAYVKGTPAGYFELERQAGNSVEIAYFGLLEQFMGKGLGGALLTDAIREAFAFGGERVWLHTCSLDHPMALKNYEARGFRIFRSEEVYEELPDEPLTPWPGAYADISDSWQPSG